MVQYTEKDASVLIRKVRAARAAAMLRRSDVSVVLCCNVGADVTQMTRFVEARVLRVGSVPCHFRSAHPDHQRHRTPACGRSLTHRARIAIDAIAYMERALRYHIGD